MLPTDPFGLSSGRKHPGWGGARSGAGRPRIPRGANDYCITRGIQALLKHGRLEGLELEEHQEVLLEVESYGDTSHMRSQIADGGLPHMLIPWHRLTRDISAGGDGSSIIPTELEVSQHLLGSSAAAQVGCRFLGPGLKGNLALTRINRSVIGSWLEENAPAPPSDPGFDQLILTPRRIAAQVIYSTQLFTQATDLDGLLRSDFSQVLSQQVDFAILVGRGPTQNEPLGLWSNPDVNKPAIGGGDVWEWGWYSQAEQEADNFVASGLSFGAIASPSLKKIWQDLSKFAPGATGGATIWEAIPNKSYTPVLGPEDAVAAGPWGLVTIGIFGPAIDLIVDRYSLGTSAQARFFANVWVDCVCRLPEAFSMTIRATAPPPLQQQMPPSRFPPPPSPPQPSLSPEQAVSASGSEVRAQNSGGPRPGKMKVSHLFK